MTKTFRLLSLVALLAASSFASVVAVTTPGGLSATDSLDWGQVGLDLTIVGGPFNVTSAMGNTVTVSNGTNDFYAVQQGNTWGGNFAPGENLIYNQMTGSVTLAFLTPIAGFGTHFQSVD